MFLFHTPEAIWWPILLCTAAQVLYFLANGNLISWLSVNKDFLFLAHPLRPVFCSDRRTVFGGFYLLSQQIFQYFLNVLAAVVS